MTATYPRPHTLLVSVVVPGNPIPKARARVMDGYTYTPKRTRDYEQLVRYTVKQQYPDLVADDSEYAIRLVFYRQTNVRADWDNLAKEIADSLTGLIWLDDNQIVDARVQVFRGVGRAAARMELLIWRLDPEVGGG